MALVDNEVIKEITNDAKRNVAVNVHFIPLPLLSIYKGLGYKIEDYPNTYQQYSCEISLPIYPQLTTEQLEYICKSIEDSYQEVMRG